MKTRGFLAAILFVGLAIGISSSLAPGGKEPLRMLPEVSSKYRMVFASNRTGDFGIYSVNLDGSGLTKLMDRPDIDEFPFCSPDGKIIAVQSDLYGRNSEICLMGADGSGLKNWTDNPADDLYPYWSLGSKRIAFMSNRRGNHDIYIGSIDGSSALSLIN